MDSAFAITLISVGCALAACLWVFALVSKGEGERRATRVSALAGLAVGATLVAMAAVPAGPRRIAVGVLIVLVLAAAVAWFLPIGTSVPANGRPDRRVDERDIVFARARLEPGTERFDAYYAAHPGHRQGDERTRSLPGLLSDDARMAEPEAFATARGSFELTEALKESVDGPVAPVAAGLGPEEASRLVKQVAAYHGAVDVGITLLRDYHVYSHVGRGSGEYGSEIEMTHAWAIAFAVEMDHGIMRAAPEAPVVAESARQYVEAAKIGIQLAATIREMGYPARAHIDGNYQVIAPLVAVDAGLGEIGRRSILMTPRLGPRVRLGVVTTDLPLSPDGPGDDSTVLDFCATCLKCAENCPSSSIPFGDREAVDGGLRWVLDADTCFRYWNLIGTDCGKCMAVCPYSHPDNAAHSIIRWTLRRSGAARRAALWTDDLVYGRRP
ncbi:4Fe-4S dicluster domain-containing protein [bacterium]|nr:4Fe-4S dicluster domain-containing protein [bacterium]